MLVDFIANRICDYLLGSRHVAGATFVTKCKVLGAPEMPSRLMSCHATGEFVRKYFDFLGNDSTSCESRLERAPLTSRVRASRAVALGYIDPARSPPPRATRSTKSMGSIYKNESTHIACGLR